MAESIPMTRAGAEAIKRELKRLKSVDRPQNVHDIAVAREHGDLRENAEYHAAKERQSHIDGRIKMLEDRLARAQIIDVSKLSGERVVFGATVKLQDTDSGAETRYTIVGETEADLKKGRGRRLVTPKRAWIGSPNRRASSMRHPTTAGARRSPRSSASSRGCSTFPTTSPRWRARERARRGLPRRLQARPLPDFFPQPRARIRGAARLPVAMPSLRRPRRRG